MPSVKDAWFNAYAWLPQWPRACKAGSMAFPKAVREYSTLGGISLYCWRWTILLCSNSSKDLESITLEMPFNRRYNSLKRIVSC